MQNKTAILIFARSAKVESNCKLLHVNSAVNKRLHQALYNKTLQTVQETALPYFIFDEKKQTGSYLGEALSNAYQNIFDKGFENVISVGSDCVNLSGKEILQAQQLLKQNKNVIGPDARHGAYLIGLNKNNFCKQKLSALRWSTGFVLHDLLRYFDGFNAQVQQLGLLSDINNIRDLIILFKKILVTPFIKFIFLLLLKCNNFRLITRTSFHKLFFSFSLVLRGPPAFSKI